MNYKGKELLIELVGFDEHGNAILMAPIIVQKGQLEFYLKCAANGGRNPDYKGESSLFDKEGRK